MAQAAFSILPERRQRVHILTRRFPWAVFAWTDFRFGRSTRFVLLLAWLTLLPTAGPLPQISQFLLILKTSRFCLSETKRLCNMKGRD